jgi:hypothetical protein
VIDNPSLIKKQLKVNEGQTRRNVPSQWICANEWGFAGTELLVRSEVLLPCGGESRGAAMDIPF